MPPKNKKKDRSYPRRQVEVIPALHIVDPHYRQAFIENITGRAPLPEFEAPYGRAWGQYYNPKTDRLSTVKRQVPIQGPPNYDQIWYDFGSIGKDWNRSALPLPTDEIKYLQTASERLGRIRFIGRLGKGGFGMVWLVKTRRGKQRPQFMACKVIPISALPSNYHPVKDMVESLIADTLLINHLSQHPNICQIIDTVGIPDRQTGFPYSRYCIFMEYCKSDMNQFLVQYLPDPQRCIIWLRQIGSAVQYLHANRVIHMDIKPSNILLQKDLTAKLCDFGLAVALPISGTLYFHANIHIGTEPYSAPEVGGNKAFRAQPCDVFSLGMTIAECMMGSQEFDSLSQREIIDVADEWAQGGDAYLAFGPCDYLLGGLIQSMLIDNPNHRATIDDVMADPILMRQI